MQEFIESFKELIQSLATNSYRKFQLCLQQYPPTLSNPPIHLQLEFMPNMQERILFTTLIIHLHYINHNH